MRESGKTQRELEREKEVERVLRGKSAERDVSFSVVVAPLPPDRMV